jgi:hypothetical protein
MSKKKTTKKTAEKKTAKRIGMPNLQVLEFTIKNMEGSPLITESKAGAETLKREVFNESMDPKRNAGLKKQRPGGEAGSSNEEGEKKINSGVRTDEVLDLEFQYSTYPVEGEKDSYGLPAAGFRKSVEDIAKNKAVADLAGTDISRNIWVLHDCKSEWGDYLVRIKCSKPYREEALGKNSGLTGAPRVISRARFDQWEARLRVRFDADRFEPEEILSLFARAGMTDGYGGFRLGKGHIAGGYQITAKPAPKLHKKIVNGGLPKIQMVK